MITRYLTAVLAAVAVCGAAADPSLAQDYFRTYAPSSSHSCYAAQSSTYNNYQPAWRTGYTTTAYPSYTPTVSTYFYVPQTASQFRPARNRNRRRTESLFNRGPILIMSDDDGGSKKIDDLESQIEELEEKIEKRVNLHEERLMKQSEILKLIEQNIQELTQRVAPRE